MSDLRRIFLFGAGGHARAVSEVVRREGRYCVDCVLDDHATVAPRGLPAIIGGRDDFERVRQRGVTEGFIAVGNNADRELLTVLATGAGLTLVTIVDPATVVASDAVLGAGTILMPMSFVGANGRVGNGVIVNTSATIDHDCAVEDFAHLSVGVNLAGGCRIGARAFVGIGAKLCGAVTIGERASIGAGAAVVSDVGPGVVAAGVPAREISSSP